MGPQEVKSEAMGSPSLLRASPSKGLPARSRANQPRSYPATIEPTSGTTERERAIPQTIDTVLLKAASRCNLNCTYCYVYNMGDEGWRSQPKRMSAEVIDAIIDQLGALAAAQSRALSVVMHGGEPLMLGLEAMTRLVAGLNGALPKGCGVHVQTNGVLLTERFIELFATYDVGISISYDGPGTVHDRSRLDKRGRGSHQRVLAAIERLRAHPAGPRLFSGVLAVVDPASDPRMVYDALKATGAPGFDLLYRDGNRSRLPSGKARLSSTEFGEWMAELLSIYVRDPQPPRIRVLDDMMRLILGGQGRKEGVGLTDYGILVIDTDGSVTKNDTLKAAYGEADRFRQPWSILNRNLLAQLQHSEFERYHALQRPSSPACLVCSDLAVCGGGMPAHRWSDETGYDNPTVFCADQKLLIAQMRSYLMAAKAIA